MRLLICLVAATLCYPALAQDTTAEVTLPAGIMFNTSISINAPLTSTDRAAKATEEDAYRKSLYARSVGECAALIETIAKACTITAVNVSTQINANPGQPDYLYATANITMQVELK